MTALPKGHTAVMADRRDKAREARDDFPTPPWGTRAGVEHLLKPLGAHADDRILEPACGREIMASVLRESFSNVEAFDAFDYGGNAVGNFLSGELDYRAPTVTPDWVFTNPPFKHALAFVEEGLYLARKGVCVLVRLAFMEGQERYKFFAKEPYSYVAPSADRIPMVEGRWDPDAATATAYGWFVWLKDMQPSDGPRVILIPFGARKRYTRLDDIERFASQLYKLGCPGDAEGRARKLFGSEAAALQWWHGDRAIFGRDGKDRAKRAVARIKDLEDLARRDGDRFGWELRAMGMKS